MAQNTRPAATGQPDHFAKTSCGAIRRVATVTNHGTPELRVTSTIQNHMRKTTKCEEGFSANPPPSLGQQQ